MARIPRYRRASTITSLAYLRRGRYRQIMGVGLAFLFAGLVSVGMGFRDVQVLGVGIPDFWLLMMLLMVTGIGLGVINPPANNAGMELLPSKLASITGLRGMFRSVGGVLSSTVILYLLAGAPDTGLGLRTIFLVQGLLLPLLLSLIFLMPTGREEPLASEMVAARAHH